MARFESKQSRIKYTICCSFGVLNSRFIFLTRLKSERKLSNRKRTDFLTTFQDVVNSCTAIVAI